jgi:predicted histone-like DNA-binding protein
MVNYILQELSASMGNGEKRVCPKLQIYSQLGEEETIREMTNSGCVAKGQARAVFDALGDTLLRFLSEGHSVRVGGIGTFSLSLEFADKKAVGTSVVTHSDVCRVCVKDINFKPDPELLRQLKEQTVCCKTDQALYCVEPSPYTFEERARRACDFISRHGVLHLNDYVRVNGVCRTKASAELKKLSGNPDSGIVAHGSGSHRTWVAG